MIKYSIVITTKNRLEDLKFTLLTLQPCLERSDVELLICDDASDDDTQGFLKEYYQQHTLILNSKSRGLIYNRNVLNTRAKGDYIISLDDDANFLSENFLEEIELLFLKHPKCGIQSLRIFWGKNKPESIETSEVVSLSRSFVGCGHVWRKETWEAIKNYPAWFVFYGEEDYASYQLFKNNWEIYYNPKVLIHHRVDVKSRKNNKDYIIRLRRSLRSGWYLYLMFFPLQTIPKKILYTLWMQLKTKVFKGDIKSLWAIFGAILDLIVNLPRLIYYSNRLTTKELKKISGFT